MVYSVVEMASSPYSCPQVGELWWGVGGGVGSGLRQGTFSCARFAEKTGKAIAVPGLRGLYGLLQ